MTNLFLELIIGYIGIAGDTDSGDFDIVDWIRVRKLADNEPIVTVEMSNTFDTKYWIKIDGMVITNSVSGQEKIIFVVDDTQSYYFDTTSRSWKPTDGTFFNTISQIDTITQAEWERFPLSNKLEIKNIGIGQLTISITKTGDVAYEEYPFYSISGNSLFIRNVYDEPIDVVIKTFKTSI